MIKDHWGNCWECGQPACEGNCKKDIPKIKTPKGWGDISLKRYRLNKNKYFQARELARKQIIEEFGSIKEYAKHLGSLRRRNT